VRATGIAKAAEACAEAGNPERASRSCSTSSKLIYEATTLLTAQA
jgi:hypothetical protein